jgi:hypothetical protein
MIEFIFFIRSEKKKIKEKIFSFNYLIVGKIIFSLINL